jgi:predicted TIM-barrel fold metal-dependent hydrolase
MESSLRARDIPVVDAHHHFWDLEHNYHPWLCDEPPIPFRYGDYRAIRTNYLPQDYARDSAAFDVVASVYVETEWDPADPTGETRWIEGIADRHGLSMAVVAQAWLDREDVEEVLAAQSSFGRVRSVRHKPRAAAHPGAVEPGAAGSMGDARWRRGYALLERYGLAFDLQTPLAMERLARAPNAVVKISGLGRPDAPWTVESNGPIVLDTIAMFGMDRCMFASNFPVDGLTADFDTIYGGFMEIVEHLPMEDQHKLFSENARRIYRPA